MMFNPLHPGETLKELYLDPLELTITGTAKSLKMTRAALSEIVNGKRSITPNVAIKLAKAFSGSAESWLQQQASYDLWVESEKYAAEDVAVLYG
ncbi:MAG: addiction module antidote protein, HigA family [Moraxellaceae bacterium]|nr:MAG: addiction module antidote protein, HigA family [Moraxellaceae bacterium]